MTLTKTMAEALNKQFYEELYSSYLYESMAADFAYKNYPGFANWMTIQAAEEKMHAEKIKIYLEDSAERVVFPALPAPQQEWKNPLDAMKAALAHEQHITGCIHDLVRVARKEDDIATETFLSWYVTEQVEEEANAQTLIDKLEMVGDNKVGMYQLDQEVSTRQQGAE